MVILMFIIGTVFGSFYNVVGYRIPNGESIIFPSSHCTKCGHKLKFYELIPILSYIFLKGRCLKCHDKISLFYPLFELLTGLLFSLAYLSFGFSYELIIALTFISMLVIVTVSDYQYMIIPDEVLLFFGFLLLIEVFFIYGLNACFDSIFNGIAAFLIMLLIKIIGDKVFKRESMGGGDIKLMFIFGIVLSWPISILSIFVGSFLGFPITLFLYKKDSNHEIPFGPFLALGALILLLMHIDLNTVINFYLR